MNNSRKLMIALIITLTIMVAEFVGGYFANSLALISDAGHMLTDALVLLFSLLAAFLALRPADKERTFGYHRVEILSAFFNGTLLILLAGYIFYQAIGRFANPEPVNSALMMIVAVIGLVANIVSAFILAGSHQNLNVRGALLHVISDALSSVVVVAGGVVIAFTGWSLVDPVLGIAIALVVLYGAIRLVFDAVNILLEGAPKGIDPHAVADDIKRIKGIKGLHDLHVWTISSGLNAISAHLEIEPKLAKKAPWIIHEVEHLLKDKYAIGHSTFQTECQSCGDDLFCVMERGEAGGHHH
ncbi:MAG: cation diffusion facilitator family transporter [Candidatus Margulisiibacteriota bacterium]